MIVKKRLFLFCIVLLLIGSSLFLYWRQQEHPTKEKNHSTSQTTTVTSTENSVVSYSDVSETDYSAEQVTLTVQELSKYREQIEQAGYDNTLFSDQEVQKMVDELSKNGQSVAEYLQNQTDKKTNSEAIKKARSELINGGIDANRMHDNEIIELLKQAQKTGKSIIEVANNR